MSRRWFGRARSAACLSLLVFDAGSRAAERRPSFVTARNEAVEISARLILSQEEQSKAIGAEMPGQFVMIEMRVVPRGGFPVTLSRDNFILRSARDNEHGTADSPDRIAGTSVLVLGRARAETPPGENSSGAGGAPPAPAPALGALQEKELPLGEQHQPVSGFLYFLVNPKQKAKNFYLQYKGPGGNCELEFK